MLGLRIPSKAPAMLGLQVLFFAALPAVVIDRLRAASTGKTAWRKLESHCF